LNRHEAVDAFHFCCAQELGRKTAIGCSALLSERPFNNLPSVLDHQENIVIAVHWLSS